MFEVTLAHYLSQVRGRFRPFTSNFGQQKPLCDWSQGIDYIRRIFVAKNSEDDCRAFGAKFIAPRSTQRSCARRIVRAINHNLFVPDLETCGPFNVREPFSERVI